MEFEKCLIRCIIAKCASQMMILAFHILHKTMYRVSNDSSMQKCMELSNLCPIRSALRKAYNILKSFSMFRGA